MSNISILAEGELDVVMGGLLDAGNGGNGGNGGTALNGANITFGNGLVGGVNVGNNQSSNGNSATSNGGNGGAGGSIHIHI